jgi:hypothetical protein
MREKHCPPPKYMLILDVYCFLVLEPDSLFVFNIFTNSLTLIDNSHYQLIFYLGKKGIFPERAY